MSEEPKLSMNEHDEPISGNAQMPVGVAVVLALLGYIGCTKVDELNANFASNGRRSSFDCLFFSS